MLSASHYYQFSQKIQIFFKVISTKFDANYFSNEIPNPYILHTKGSSISFRKNLTNHSDKNWSTYRYQFLCYFDFFFSQKNNLEKNYWSKIRHQNIRPKSIFLSQILCQKFFQLVGKISEL